MADLHALETTSLVIPLINIAVALPLVLEKVPRNYFYGFRTRRTLANDEIWYEANRLGGKDLLIASIVALIARAGIMQVATPPVTGMLSMGVLLAAMVAALLHWSVQMRSL